eukprot:CAMPEP_0117560758 /NCGR_PEP_ID=MMETSP0784-20121206/54042_1 /TAXON_ID=39447 /ORGANISM="" /LENGTH=53 /DNA_ID=CAMNT_0005358179 /DNA_START=272 /DNA_END=430 /DNA_ORIENTATION=-
MGGARKDVCASTEFVTTGSTLAAATVPPPAQAIFTIEPEAAISSMAAICCNLN